MTPAKQLNHEIGRALVGERTAGLAVRRPEYETKSRGTDPGMDPPSMGNLGVGRAVDSYKDLYWSRLASEYKKEAPLRARASEAALRVELFVEHAPDDHTPIAHVEWSDPMDVRGATKFARALVEEGAAYVNVKARAWRPMQQGKTSIYDLAKWIQV